MRRADSLHLLGKTKSETARKVIEIQYDLQQAGKKSNELRLPERIPLKQVSYGKTETKRAFLSKKKYNILNNNANYD